MQAAPATSAGSSGRNKAAETLQTASLLDADDDEGEGIRISPSFDDRRWKLDLHNNKKAEMIAVYLHALPRNREKLSMEQWKREGVYVFCFQILTPETREVVAEYESPHGSSFDDDSEEWGWEDLVAHSKLAKNDEFQEKDAMIVRCTVSLKPYLAVPPLPPAVRPISQSLLDALSAYHELPSATDVSFVFSRDFEAGTTRQILGNKDFLALRSEYFESMFQGGFSEGDATTSLTDEPPPAKRQKTDSEAKFLSIDDDDALDWLPDDYEEEPTSVSTNMETEKEKEKDERARQKIVLKDGYISYRAVIYYLHTELVAFHPPVSDFLVHFFALDTADGEGDGVDGERIDPRPDFTNMERTRRAFLLQKAEDAAKETAKKDDSTKEGEEPEETEEHAIELASPHAVYRLADMLGIAALKKKAKQAIRDGYTVENILYEVISSFSNLFSEMEEAAEEYAWEHWDEVKATPAFSRSVTGASQIEGGSEILLRLIKGIPTAPATS